jgi:hypothetical protein
MAVSTSAGLFVAPIIITASPELEENPSHKDINCAFIMAKKGNNIINC